MPYQPYQDAGSAFSGGMESFLVERAAAARQARLDQQAAIAANDRHLEAEAALKEKQAESLVKLEEKERAQIEKEVTGMVPGDIPDAGLIARARKYHIPLRTGINIKKDQEAGTDAGGVPTKVIQELSPDGQSGVAPAPPPPMTPAPIRFSGTPAQAKVASEEERQQKYLDSLDPKSEEARLLRYELMTGKNAPAGLADPNGTLTPDQKNYEAAKAQGYKGSLVQFMREKANFHEASTAGADGRRRDNNYKSAVTELEKATAPLSDHVKNIDELGIMLNQNTPAADAHIAPMVLKAVVGGQGSGFRITQAEINQVVGARSKWESLQAALNKWATDPSQALLITDPQRKELRDLARAIRKKAQAKLDKASTVRQQLDDADDVDAIHRIMTKFKGELYQTTDETEEKKPKSAADYIKQYGGGQ